MYSTLLANYLPIVFVFGFTTVSALTAYRHISEPEMTVRKANTYLILKANRHPYSDAVARVKTERIGHFEEPEIL